MSYDVNPRIHRIVRNAIRCRNCNTVIESEYTHDFRWCECGGVAIDGGRSYLARSGTDYEELAVVVERKER